MIFIFLIFLRPALLAAEGGSKNPLHWLALLIALPLDIVVAHTTWALVFGMPKRREWTVSDTLERLVADYNHPRWALALSIAREINKQSPTGKHIKAAA